MRIKKGMYVRTKITDNCNNVYIVKITEIDEDNKDLFYIDEDIYDCWGDAFNFIEKDDIKKASYDIIDLIEEGDYVNGHKIDIVSNISELNPIGSVLYHQKENYDYEMILGNDIKSIVTKEQFDNMKYEVE